MFGALRFADEHELEVWQLAPRLRMPWRRVQAGTRELVQLGLVRRRRADERRFFSVTPGVVR